MLKSSKVQECMFVLYLLYTEYQHTPSTNKVRDIFLETRTFWWLLTTSKACLKNLRFGFSKDEGGYKWLK